MGTILEMKCGESENDGAFIYKIGDIELLSENKQKFWENMRAITSNSSGENANFNITESIDHFCSSS